MFTLTLEDDANTFFPQYANGRRKHMIHSMEDNGRVIEDNLFGKEQIANIHLDDDTWLGTKSCLKRIK